MLLGFADVWVELAVGLSILATLVCAIYGIVNWNRGRREGGPTTQTMIWLRDDRKIEEDL